MYFLIIILAINFLIIGFEMAQGLIGPIIKNERFQSLVQKISDFFDYYFKSEPPVEELEASELTVPAKELSAKEQ